MKKQILIVEDQRSTRKLLSHYLSNYYTIVETDSATAAIDLLNKGVKPNAIVADILMPGPSGIDFLSQLKESNFNYPVLMLSSVENSKEKMNCFNLGAKDYLVKPFNPAELLARLQNINN